MAKITASGETFETQTFEVENGVRLVKAIEDQGIDILHRCGGYAKCTTCRVSFDSGEPGSYTEGEKSKLEEKGDMGEYRLSCQILCEGEMEVTVMMTQTSTGLDDVGPDVTDEIQND